MEEPDEKDQINHIVRNHLQVIMHLERKLSRIDTQERWELNQIILEAALEADKVITRLIQLVEKWNSLNEL